MGSSVSGRDPCPITTLTDAANKVVFCTGGAGTICSAQVRALVHLGANACIIGRNVEKTERVAQDIATARPGAKVIGIGSVDVRKLDNLQQAVERCVKELGGIDFVMYANYQLKCHFDSRTNNTRQCWSGGQLPRLHRATISQRFQVCHGY
jgi:NAD(P)-dependent dehydrogenase (short-subunit alcohol dehydrogenase family)